MKLKCHYRTKWFLLFLLLIINLNSFCQLKLSLVQTQHISFPTKEFEHDHEILPTDTIFPIIEDFIVNDDNDLESLVSISVYYRKKYGYPEIGGRDRIPLYFSFNTLLNKHQLLYYHDAYMFSDYFVLGQKNLGCFAGTANFIEDHHRVLKEASYYLFNKNTFSPKDTTYVSYYSNGFDTNLYLKNAVFLKEKFFSSNYIYKARALHPIMIGYVDFYNNGLEKSTNIYRNSKNDGYNGIRAFMYFWGDTASQKIWFIEESWDMCDKKLVYHDDTFSFIEAWGMDTVIDPNSTNRCRKDCIFRKMTLSGEMIWERKCPVKLHKTDIRRIKSPFMEGTGHFYLIDNSNSGVGFKGPKYREFMLYKFDTSGNLLLSKKLDFPFDDCGQASWPVPDACGNLFTIFQNMEKTPNGYVKSHVLYMLDPGGNIKWHYRLPDSINWFGSQHIAIGKNNDVFLASSKVGDSVVYLKFSEEKPNIVDQSNSSKVCKGAPINIYVSAKNAVRYEWYHNGVHVPNSNDSFLFFPKASKVESGTYRCIVFSCLLSDTSENIEVTVLGDSFSVSRTICQGDSMLFGTYYVSTGGQYSSLSTNYLGCDSFMFLSLATVPRPYKPLPKDTTFCINSILRLDALNEGATYMWNTGETTREILVKNGGLYYVTVSRTSCSVVDTITIGEKVCDLPVYIPNAFSPNGNDLNEIFMPVTSIDFTDYLFIVYNRWGQEVFRTTDQTKGWDGTFKNKDCPEGVYLYVVNYKSGDDSFLSKTGNVSLVR